MTQQAWPSRPRETALVTFPDGRVFEAPVGEKAAAANPISDSGALAGDRSLPAGTPVRHFITAAYPDRPVPFMAALVDGRLRELTYPIRHDSAVEPLDLSQSDGVRIYRRSLTFLLVTAVKRLFPGADVFVDHSLPFGGYYCEASNHPPFTEEELQAISDEMWRMVEANYPIERQKVPLEEALQVFRDRNEMDKVAVFQTRNRRTRNYLVMYNLDGYRDYMHGYMVPSTGYLRYFQLLRWETGFILQFPRRHQPTRLQPPRRDPKLLKVFRDYGTWLRLLGVENVGELNAAADSKKMQQIVLVSEALHEQRIAEIAHQIWERRAEVRVVLIAGPSSSGKTTFSKRLAVQLLAHGLRPYALELDNYFVNREQTPRDEKGEYDFEALEAVDIALFNQHLQALMRGEKVQLPRFNFITGVREAGRITQLLNQEIIIVEGIHGLNPQLVPALPQSCTFRIFVSALTQLNLDRHNRVPTTDTRLIRRIIRDARTRGYTAADTLSRWESVRRGEKRHILPYQENADAIFNSALVYELSIMKPFAEPLLLQVDTDTSQWVEAKRLLTFLQWFRPAEITLAPENSLLREFVGGLSLETFHWGE